MLQSWLETVNNHDDILYYCLSATYCFIPVAVESKGALGQDAIEFLHELGGRIAAATGNTCSSEFLFQRLSVAIQRSDDFFLFSNSY